MLLKDFIGEDFILKFSENELFSCYGKMLTNRFKIKNDQETLGLGLYLSPSSLDHSCEPNCDVLFDGSKIIVKLNRDLKPGEQPLISYCDLSMNKQQRKTYLEENYFFKCYCSKCVNIDEDFEIYLPCGSTVQYKELKNQPNTIDCLVCKNHTIDIDECLEMKKNKLNIKRRHYEIESQKYEKLKVEMASVKVKNEVVLDQEFVKLKNAADLRREELRKQIDEYYFKLLDEIEDKRNVCLKKISEKADEINSFKQPVEENSIEFYKQNLMVMEKEVKNLENFINFSQNGTFYDLKSKMKNSKMNKIFGQISFNEQYIKNNFKFEYAKKFVGHQGHVMRAQYIDNDKLISACDDHTLRLWDLNTGECLKKFRLGHVRPYNPVCLIVQDDKHFLVDTPVSINLWDIESGQCIKAYERNPDNINFNDNVFCLKITQNGHLLCGSQSGIEIWDLKFTKSIKSLDIHSDDVYYFEETDDQLILSGSGDKTIKLWDLEANVKKTYVGHREAIRIMKIINKETFASAGRDKTVKIWKIESGECLKTFEGYDYTITFLDLLDNNFIMSCCVNGLIKIWNLDTGACVMKNQTRKGEICQLSKNKNEIINIGVNQEVIEIWKNNVIV